MTVYIFGNPNLPEDSLPIRLLPKLKAKFPDIDFQIKDPNEDWDIPEEMTVIDTVAGIDRVTVFSDVDRFVSAPRLTLHDFDLGSYLKYLKKLGKLKNIKIIGVPPTMSEEQVSGELESVLK
ncbi:hypothetical protein HYW67_02545 [Candidatus Parcubacteria bacterium]|nr:hypothetical protein [Candidatus Parcubacteria bacterium]